MIKPFCDLIFISFTELVQYIFDERLLDFCYVVYWWLHLLSLSESRLSLLLSPGEGNILRIDNWSKSGGEVYQQCET